MEYDLHKILTLLFGPPRGGRMFYICPLDTLKPVDTLVYYHLIMAKIVTRNQT